MPEHPSREKCRPQSLFLSEKEIKDEWAPQGRILAAWSPFFDAIILRWGTAMESILRKIALVSFLSFFFLSQSYAMEQRHALVIGNVQYETGRLKNPANDATDVAAALQQAGFSVKLLKNARLSEMEEALELFGNKLKRGGVGLFYFAGHGFQVNGANYLIPIGAKIKKESDAKYQALDTDRVLDEMANANNGLNIVVLDSCRDNPFGHSFRSSSRGLAIIGSAPVGTLISYSTGPGQIARDGDGRNSPYTSALIEYIKKPGLTLEEVFKGVRQKVRAETGQVPWELSSLEGSFYFHPGAKAIERKETYQADAKPASAPVRRGREHASIDLAAIASLESYLSNREIHQNEVVSKAEYEGEIKDDLPSGFGKCKFYYGDKWKTYEGIWKEGLPDGQGEMIWYNGHKHSGQYRAGKREGMGRYDYANGATYTGEFRDNKFSGQATYVYANSDKYVGEFKNDKRNGQGSYIYHTGETYTGEFKDGKIEGRGTFTFPNGNRYVGEFKNEKRNGQGAFSFANGDTYTGHFTEDKIDGRGTYIFPNGNRYVGEFKNEKRNGWGDFIFADGRRQTGRWADDRFLGNP